MKSLIEKIEEYSLEEIMGERFGRYSKFIIQDRAIPDIRDGLKPVQRRILFAMYKENNTYDRPYKKSAHVVGDVMGKYHPHGDSSIYDAIVRISQQWKQRVGFIDMHGNNGSIDGDPAAAYRYTEIRLTKIANELVKDIDKDTVIMSPNYDDQLLEPTVLPARFPNLLVNGSLGISAGYATNIPPHNLGEVIDATIKRIDKPNCSLNEIIELIPGPDFPTGGIVEGKEGIIDAYKTGRGKIVVRSKYEVVTIGSKKKIIITEIPYDVNKANLVHKIEEIRIEKKIDGIIEVRDESDRNGLQISIDIKKESNEELIINYLLKNTDLQISYNFNMVAIANRRPKLVGLFDILDAYIIHQKEVITRRTNFDLAYARKQFHITEGIIKALSILDEVIAAIRASKNKADAEQNLVIKFGFTEEQAKAIVLLQLYKLTNTDVEELKIKLENLKKIIAKLELILSDEIEMKRIMKLELKNIKEEFATPRLTEIKDEITEIKIDNNLMISKEDVIVVVSKDGYIKRVSNRSYAAANNEETLLKDNDYVLGIYELNTIDTLLLFTNLGNYLYIPVNEIPDLKWKELGKHISNIIEIKENETIIGVLPVTNFEKEIFVTSFTKKGIIKRSILSEFKVSRYSKPLSYIKLKEQDEVVNIACDENKEIFITTAGGYGLWYDTSEVPVIGLKTAGVKAINLKNDLVISGNIFNIDENNYITVITNKGLGKRIKISDFEKTSRAKRGLLLMKEIKSNPQKVVASLICDSKSVLGIKTVNGIKEIKSAEIPIMDRYSTGSSLLKDNILSAYKVFSLKEKQEDKKEVSLEEIDKRFLTIDDFLNNVKE
ncbi:MAG TPA: DNA topoisomerase IV subunit A [Bacilli bacterium]|nr:DNA topoisomerase IV subunit A [Bacilli bacterium]